MMLKRLISTITASALLLALPLAAPDAFGGEIKAEAADASSYSYTVTPLLKPFNTYFYVKTDNPDPMTFRFVDKSTVYAENGAYGSLEINWDSWDEEMILYSDVDYENKDTGRVNGGYIFKGSNTDGGEVVLQYKKQISYSEYKKLKDAGDTSNIGELTETTSSSDGFKTYRIVGYYKWEELNKKITLPKLKNTLDYLVDTYATKGNFFDNMDAVQKGFGSICLYSRSYIRGNIEKPGENWALSNSPHADQLFYIQSPYKRTDNKKLFAGYLYPYFADSIGFPSTMASVAKKLAPDSTYTWDSYSHYMISVTYKGQTKKYGGQGEGEGQAISEDKILHRFNFGKTDSYFNNLSGLTDLLREYMGLTIENDFYAEDELTFQQITDTVGDGAWVKLMLLTSIYGGTAGGYTYLYKQGDGTASPGDSINTVGAKQMWGGNPGHCSDCWVDGRYINSHEVWEMGAKLEDHPKSNIMLMNVEFFETDPYYKEIKPVVKPVKYKYSEANDRWEATTDSYLTANWYISGKVGYDYIKQLSDEGKIDAKYLKNMILSRQQVEKLADANTNSIPMTGYIYDGSVKAGTPFKYNYGDLNVDGKINMRDYVKMQRLLLEPEYTWNQLADMHTDGKINMLDYTAMQRYLLS